MNYPLETAPGQLRGWNLLEKIGEGDAGEVFRVESLLDHRIAILKRPSRSAFASDLIRQASQIQREGEILTALSTIESPVRMMRIPEVYDQSRPGTEFTERFFIIISPAAGFSLDQLARLIHFQMDQSPEASDFEINPASTAEKYFLAELVKLGKLPDLLLLRAAAGLLEFLETIHAAKFEVSRGTCHGVIWNDIKPDHMFWDAEQLRFTLIDWGNSQFLESDGVSKDRQHSRVGDIVQYLQEIGRFISASSPELYLKLSWPEGVSPTTTYSNLILPLKNQLEALLKSELAVSRSLRREESDLLNLNDPQPSDFIRLSQIQHQIIAQGEIPDFTSGSLIFQKAARPLIESGNIEEFIELCRHLENSSIFEPAEQGILESITSLFQKGKFPSQAVLSALEGDWINTLWELRLASINQPEPDWWQELSREIRQIEIGAGNLQPYAAAQRLYHALQSQKSKTEKLEEIQAVQDEFKSRLLARWRQQEPDPPDSGIDYSDSEGILHRAAKFAPEAAKSVFGALSQASLQSQNALAAWERGDFKAAQAALRRILLWDPDRLRLITADRALQITASWLEDLRLGLVRDEPLQEFITRQELIGRELRNQVGPASWLNSLLAAFKGLRKGADPTDVLLQFPESRSNLDWLITLEPRRPLLASAGKVLKIERSGMPEPPPVTLSGMQEARFGKRRGMHLGEPLDTWTPEARGSTARLFSGNLLTKDRRTVTAAFKVMRPDRVDYALPLFREEAHVLSLMRDVSGVVRMIECGFLQLEDNNLPPEDRTASAAELAGEAQRYGLDSIHNFLSDMEMRITDGWLPYLALEKIDRQANLLLKCDIGYTNGHFLPTLEGLIMAIQICEILDTAHKRSIIYRDHKILHYYWLEEYNGVAVIDWNVAKRFSQGLSSSEIQFDLVQFGARALHPILTGRAAQGALPLGPNKPEEIEAAARTYEVNWTYDDQRLPKDVKEILAAVLGGEYSSARILGEDLLQIYQKLSALL